MSAPTKIGRYEIVRRLGKSMTDVYLAIDTVENRKAALKLIPTGGDATNRLILEAERRGAAIQQQLQELDSRMVQVYEYGDQDGYFYIAMQYVEGRNLAQELHAEKRIDPQRAAIIAIEICEQLAKFHSRETTVVHGDIKPSNIHLSPNDTVRLLDFGIAKTLRANADSTAHGFGSPSYCSPERLERSQVDEQSDLWAVGATLYEMLAGVPPYRADNTRKLEQLIRSLRPPRALPASCPRVLKLIVSKALAGKPERRYRSADALRQDLQKFLEHRTTLAEIERRGAAGATMEVAREVLKRATRTVRRVNRALKVAGAAGWFLAGMALWIGGTMAVQEWAAHHRIAKIPPKPVYVPVQVPPPAKPEPPYAATADAILQAYRESRNPRLQQFDWYKAEVLYERAVELGASDDATGAKLALTRGYAMLVRGGASRAQARAEFLKAAGKLPWLPTPASTVSAFALAERQASVPVYRQVRHARPRPQKRRKSWR
ncbi:MAG TPA: serine/threonine-protein kinase [Candidatus Limnocylindrales bacterium]|nr:serine/threonine-protein kinase [Candidatus Limnocylindrales bacterium]